VSEDGALRYARDNAEVIWQVPVAVAILSVFYAVVGVAVASLTTRRIIAGATIAGLFLISAIVSDVLVGQREQVVEESIGPPQTTASPGDARCAVLDEEGRELSIPCDEGGRLDPGPAPSQTDVYYVVRSEPSAAALLNLWTLPLVVRDLVFLGNVEPGHPLSGVDGGGALAVVELTIGVAVAGAVLLRRYHEVER
jgi:hypothetical protein